jgi:hypothetical protein
MPTPSQIDANRSNAQSSTGPRTDEGKAKSSGNAVKFGLFKTNNCIFPGEEEEYARFRDGLWAELSPSGPLQEVHAAEIIRSSWRLRRCAMAEERLGWRAEWVQEDANRRLQLDLPPSDPSICEETISAQAAVDRARAQAQNSLRRAHAALEKLQSAKLSNEPNSALAEQANLQNEPNFDLPEHEKLPNEPNAALPERAKLQNEPNFGSPEHEKSPYEPNLANREWILRNAA